MVSIGSSPPAVSGTRTTMPASTIAGLVLCALLTIAPPLAYVAGYPFWLDLFTRLVILAIAATSLNLVLGYGGLVSFGHAAFLGLGAYAVGIPVHHAINGEFDAIASTNGWLHIGLAIAVSALYALVTGAISLRTRGVHFIMITMAFGQMMFFAIVSIETYGGDDGLTIYERSEFPLVDLNQPLQLYGAALASLFAAIFIVHRIVNSRFGMVLRGARGNEVRMRALGYNAYIFRLVAYVISGIMCGYAGALLGNFTTFISPEMMDWTRSGELMFMVILGGAGAIFGPVIGAAAFLLVEELLQDGMKVIQSLLGLETDISIYWHLPFGLLLIAAVLFLRGGISGVISDRGRSTSSKGATDV